MEASSRPVPSRVRRMIELVYNVPGVAGVRVWEWPGHVSIGVRPTAMATPSLLIREVERAVAGLIEPGEIWDFGFLELTVEAAPEAPAHGT